jgi:intracellular sulfur oxidation DsrE/DsrF family protein
MGIFNLIMEAHGIILLNTTSPSPYNNLTATTQYRVSVQSGVCAPQYSNIATITVLQAVTIANAGVDQVLCSTTSATLAGNTPTSGTGTWTAVAGNPSAVSFTNANDPATSVNGLTTGVYQFEWTISNGSVLIQKILCSITINPQTVPGTLAASATVCATSNAGTLTLTGYTSAVVRWESSIDNGSTWSNILNTTSLIAYNNLTATTQYRVSVQSGVCAPQYSNIATITVLQAVTIANAGVDQVLCSTTSATLSW